MLHAILDLWSADKGGLKYIPHIENGFCRLEAGMATRATARGARTLPVAVSRARDYSNAALWYAWYDPDWLADGVPGAMNQPLGGRP